MKDLIENEMTLDADSVWVRADARPFGYSDGVDAERYLERALLASTDLSHESEELERWIKDWPSEYHLSRARAQLLKGFDFKRSSRVLEVGCGCGAITRFLGETFDQVVSVEGSYARANLARKRTRDLASVSIVNSPFEEIKFRVKFDIIFCVGVFEYSNVFVAGHDPYTRILEYFADLLVPQGALVLAIENRLGLKYFCSSGEDHSGVMFDGIEGYPRRAKGPRTFGYKDLKSRLSRFFETVEFYFPCPDYKLPSCVVSERLTEEAEVAELMGAYPSRDYRNPGRRPLFSEALAWYGIEQDRLVPLFANSFLVVASRTTKNPVRADWLAIAYSGRRKAKFSTETRFLRGEGGGLRVVKSRIDGARSGAEGELRHVVGEDDWVAGLSLQTATAIQAREREATLEEIFDLSRVWSEELQSGASGTGPDRTVAGDRLDSIWRNCFVAGENCRFIDREWVWAGELPLKLVVSRGLYYFAKSLLGSSGLNPRLRGMRVSRLITTVAGFYGLTLSRKDLLDLIRFEAGFLLRTSVRGSDSRRERVAAMLDVLLVLRKKIDPPATSLAGRLLRGGGRRLKRAALAWRR